MTLRVKLEVVPHGVEDHTYAIAEINISNVEEVENLGFGHSICNYKYHCTVPDLSKGVDMLRAEGMIYNHDRRDGAIKLVEKVLTSIGSL